jgi:hypothetical protein
MKFLIKEDNLLLSSLTYRMKHCTVKNTPPYLTELYVMEKNRVVTMLVLNLSTGLHIWCCHHSTNKITFSLPEKLKKVKKLK